MPATLSADEVQDLGRTIGVVCERHASESRVREVAYDEKVPHAGFDQELWTLLCEQVGVVSMAVPESQGGDEGGAIALGAVAEQLGRVLAPVPFVASAVLATGLLIEAGPQHLLDEWLPSLIDGTRTLAAVLTPDGGLWRPGTVSVVAERGQPVLDGTARHVLHGGSADLLVVAAKTDNDVKLYAVDVSDRGVLISPEPTLDGTRPMATVELNSANAHPLSATPDAVTTIRWHVDRALAILSAEQVGTNGKVLEIATEYARTRHQFGRAIGTFQAIKHSCANMLVDLEWARSASQAALESVTTGTEELGWRASMAKAVCSQSLREASHANLQIHGGIGFTWENNAHLFLKRARTDEVIFGSTNDHWERLATDAAEVLAC